MHTLLPAHRISYQAIRSLAIECHALDLSAFTLFVDGTHRSSKSTKIAYEELLSSKLLMLAISLRTQFYQGVSPIDTVDYVIDCGFLDSNTKGNVVERPFSIKDVCDKLIHADEVKRDFIDEKNGLLTILHGNERGSTWTFHISMSLFAESVLNWLDELPDA